MPKEKNPQIGEVACPFKGCTCTARIHRYRERSAEEGKRRFAGLLYAVCDRKHRCEDQEFLLNEGDIWGADKRADDAPAAPVKSPENPAPAPVAKPSRAPAARAVPSGKPGSGSKAPTSSIDSKPSMSDEQSGWGFFR